MVASAIAIFSAEFILTASSKMQRSQLHRLTLPTSNRIQSGICQKSGGGSIRKKNRRTNAHEADSNEAFDAKLISAEETKIAIILTH
jgi:hypothetical protein